MTAPLLDIRGRVLVMDYDRARAARRCGQLTSAGWSALHAGDEAEALTHVRGGNVDVVALHVTADEAEAMDLPNVVRLAAEVPHLPVVILAPEPAEETRCQYLDICNGNLRVRAEVALGDTWAEDPACYLSDEEIGISR